MTVSVSKPVGDTSVIPEKRDITFVFKDIEPEKAECDGYDLFTDEEGNTCLTVKNFTANDSAIVVIKNVYRRKSADKKEKIIEVFSRLQGDNTFKSLIYRPFKNFNSKQELSAKLKSSVLSHSLKSILIEKLEEE